MDCVLFVDDDTSFLASLADAFANEPYTVLLARDGNEALETIRHGSVDLVVTDVHMPRLDGLQLVQAIFQLGDFIPCLVMTAFGTPTLERRSAAYGSIDFIHKPIDLRELRRRINETLQARRDTSVVRGLTLASFLQLLSMERKSCTVRVTRAPSVGLLFFREGALVHATNGALQGAEAAYVILSWGSREISVHDGCTTQHTTITDGLEAVLLEAFRRSDEGGPNEEKATMIESHLEEFKAIKGYTAAGIMDFTGDILASHSAKTSVDLAVTGAVFNDIFRAAHEAAGKIGLETCRNLAIATPKGIVVMECSGADRKPHVHMIVVLEEGGNQALVKMTISKCLPKVVADLS